MKLRRWRWELPACAIFALLGFMAGLASATGSIRLLSPKAGATLKGSVLIQAAVDAQDVSFVIFGVDGERSHATNGRPYTFMLDTTELSDGKHIIFAEAYGRGGLLCRSTPVKIKVKNGRAVTPVPVIEKPQPKAVKKAPVVKLPPKAISRPGMAALTSRAVKSIAQQESQLQALSGEPRRASQRLSLALAESPKPRAVSVNPQTAESAAPMAEEIPLSFTSSGPSIVLNGETVPFQVTPVIRNGKLEAGFRGIFSSAGGRVSWVSSLKTGVAYFQGHKIEATLGEKYAVIDGQPYELGREIKIVDNRLIIPVRPICKAAGIRVAWDQKTLTARLFSPNLPSAKTVAAAL